MSKIKNPILFSENFGIRPEALDEAGLVDTYLNVDIPLFIDPVLLEKSANPLISVNGFEAFKNHFSNFIRLLRISKTVGDAAWRAAARLLDLHEPPENGLGYGSNDRPGASRPDEIQYAIMSTSKEVVELGSSDPEMISLMGFFEENVGPDTISDFTTRVIIGALAQITEEFCIANGIHVGEPDELHGRRLPTVVRANGKQRSIVLIPRDIVRELPIARDWSEVQAAAQENDRIRVRVNSLLAGIAKPSASDYKSAIRTAALESSENFEAFLLAVKNNSSHYDPNLDTLGYYKLRSMLKDNFEGIKTPNSYDFTKSEEEIYKLVLDITNLFKHHVEKGNLWEELWVNGKPKKERAAQLFYYAIADAFCKAHNVEISPEANMGGGPIDFKFSSGYAARVLVEMKRSGGTVKHGYEKQLEFYKAASRTEYGLFVVIDFGDLGEKLEQIQEIRRSKIAAGERASDIIVVDATPKASASKRK